MSKMIVKTQHDGINSFLPRSDRGWNKKLLNIFFSSRVGGIMGLILLEKVIIALN